MADPIRSLARRVHAVLRIHLRVVFWCALMAMPRAAPKAVAGVTLPVARPSSPIAISADQANRWEQGSYEVWVLKGSCEIEQGNVSARCGGAVLWVDRAEPFSGNTSKIIAYLENDVSIDFAHGRNPHTATRRSAQTIRDQVWLGRFYTSTDINLHAPATGFAPKVKPAIYQRAVEAREREPQTIRPVQFSMQIPQTPQPPGAQPPGAAPVPWPAPNTVTVPPPGTNSIGPNAPPPSGNAPPPGTRALPPLGAQTLPPPGTQVLPPGTQLLPPGGIPAEAVPAPAPSQQPTARSIVIRSRSNTYMRGEVFPSPNRNETIAMITSGVNVIVDGIQNVSGLTDNRIDVETDRIVIWTAPLAALDLTGQSTGQKIQPKDAPLEFYMEGNIVFRQGDRVIYADRMYYNVRDQYGMVLNAEILTPAPGYQGLVRLKADVLQQLDEFHFEAQGAALTSSRIGVPRYWVQSQRISFEDIQSRPIDPFTGLPAIDPVTQEPAVDHQYLATGHNNFVYIAGVPVLYWPIMATDLNKPSFFVDRITVKSDDVFGGQVYTDLDMFHLLRIRNPPAGVNWTISPDYLSKRGFAFGTTVKYDRFGFLGQPGPARGLFDAWGLKDRGLDNLGRDRRTLVPESEYRGRVFWQHRHELPNDFQLTAEVGYGSDRNFLESYYEDEWDLWKDQTTGIELKRYNENREWALSSDVRLNDYFAQTEWLPRLDHFWIGQDLFNHFTWFAHSNVGYADLRTAERPPPGSEPAQAPLFWETDSMGMQYKHRGGLRATTRQEIDLPISLGAFKFAPYGSGELSYWQEDRDRMEVSRAVGQAGIRGSIPIWKVYPQTQSTLLNVNGLSHKLTLDADFFWADADQNLERFPLYDPLDDDSNEHFRRRFSAREYGGSIPAIYDERLYAFRSGMQSWVTGPTEIADDLMVAKFGVRQRWQTKRGLPGRQRIVDLMVLDLEGSFFPEGERDNFGEDWGMLNYDFRWHVGDRFTVLSDGYTDTFEGGLKTASIGATISRPLRGRLYVGYRHFEGPFNSDVVSASLNYRLAEKWIANATGGFDFGPTGNMYESFNLVRVGESFLVRIGTSVDHSRGAVGVNFSLEPRFLANSLGRVGGVPLPPVGAFGIE